MGKYSSGWIGGHEKDPDERKTKLKKELDQIRKNALERKRDLRNKESLLQKPKSGFIKTLNKFASQRRQIEEATEITHLINKPRIIKQEVIQPEINKPKIIKQQVIQTKDVRDVRGFFRAGIKGREVTRPDSTVEKLRNGVLQSDALQLLQSGNVDHRSEGNQQPSKYVKSPIEDDHAELKMEVAKILNDFDSSRNSSLDLDNPGTIEFPFSPVLGGRNGAKKKINHNKAAANDKHKNLRPQENEFCIVNHNNDIISKGERYRRRLFEEVTAGINEERKEIANNAQRNNEATSNATPENVIFYSKVVAREPVNKIKKHSLLKCSDPDVIKYYVQICQFMGTTDLKNMFRNNYKDPEESAKEALKLTYKRALKDYVQRQKCRSKNDTQTTPSNCEILVEPDSDIARRLKKNVAFLKEKESTATPTNSTDSTKNFVNKVNERSAANTFGDNVAKRKHAPSSKNSETEVPSSTKAVADPKSVRADVKMNSIHPDRQELVARFLEDQKSFISEASQETEEHQIREEELYINNNSKSGSFFLQKSTKYVPAILRKNRSLAECVAKEKASLMNNENYPGRRSNKPLMLDNVESECTPNPITEPVLEAPKCKYVHMNAKYKQPSRINAPPAQIPQEPDIRYQRNAVPERHSQRCPSPKKSFTLMQTYTSPIKPLSHYSDASNFHLFQLSQESMAADNGSGLTRMVSFGDIQDRTDRLTLCSQNQKCSQEVMEHAYASQQEPRPNYHCQPARESTSNCNLFQKSQHRGFFAEPPCDRTKCECSASNLRCVDRPAYVPQNEYQRIPQSDYAAAYNEANACACCHQKQSNEGMVKCLVPVLAAAPPAAPRQPIKYLAAEGNRRQPIYNPNESYSFSRKQPYCPSSRGDSSDFEYVDLMKMNYAGGGGGDRPQSFVPPPNGNQRYIVQSRQMPPSPVCQQVAVVYRHNHRPANEGYNVNDVYMHPMNRQMHPNRQ